MTEKLTADNITDEQIEHLRDTQSPRTGNCAYLCSLALDVSDGLRRYRARRACADIINERNGVTP